MKDLSKGTRARAARGASERKRATSRPIDRQATVRKDAVTRLVVGADGEGQRIDNYLQKALKGVPKRHIYRILRSGEVRLNRGRTRPDTRLAIGDELRIPPIRTAAPAARRAQAPAGGTAVPPLLYEDDALLALDKPAGLAVHGGSGIAFGLIERLRHARPSAPFLELVHRLDRDTSGVILVAKKRSALTRLHAQLREGSIEKRYLVLVRGKWRDAVRNVELALDSKATAGGERRARVSSEGRPAHTVFRRVRTWADRTPPLALLDAELKTGRTHQIRVHLTHIGFPLAGDDKYGDFAWNRALAKEGLRRMFLHAHRVRFAHPDDGREVVVTSPLPADLAGYVARLDGNTDG